MVNHQVEDVVLGKIENAFVENIFIVYVTSLLLNKSFNMMVLIPLFVSGDRNYLGIT